MLPYIPPSEPVSAWHFVGLTATGFVGTGILAIIIWAFFGSMPITGRAIHFVVGLF